MVDDLKFETMKRADFYGFLGRGWGGWLGYIYIDINTQIRTSHIYIYLYLTYIIYYNIMSINYNYMYTPTNIQPTSIQLHPTSSNPSRLRIVGSTFWTMGFWQGSSRGLEGETVKPPKPIRKTHRENHQTREIKQVLLVNIFTCGVKPIGMKGIPLLFFFRFPPRFLFFVWGCLKWSTRFFFASQVYSKLPGSSNGGNCVTRTQRREVYVWCDEGWSIGLVHWCFILFLNW